MADDTKPTAQQMVDAIKGYYRQGEQLYWYIGNCYNTIISLDLWKQPGCNSPIAFLKIQIPEIKPATLHLYGMVARNFTQPVAQKYGVGKLGRLLNYLAQAKQEVPADPGTLSLDIPLKDGTTQRMPFSDVTVEDLNRAIRALHAPPAETIPSDVSERLRDLEDKLHALGDAYGIKLAAQMHGGTVWVNLSHIPFEVLGEVSEAIQSILQTTSAVRAA